MCSSNIAYSHYSGILLHQMLTCKIQLLLHYCELTATVRLMLG